MNIIIRDHIFKLAHNNTHRTHNLSSCEIKASKEKIRPQQYYFEPMTFAIPVQCSTNWAINLSGSWSLCKFVIYPLDGEGYKWLHVHDAEQFPSSLYNFYIWFINQEQSQLCICSTHSRDRWNFKCKQLNVYCHECTWLQQTWSLMRHKFDHVKWLQCSNLRRMSVNSLVTFQPSFLDSGHGLFICNCLFARNTYS